MIETIITEEMCKEYAAPHLWNGKSLGERFEEVAKHNQDRAAVVARHKGISWTYGELNLLTNRIALFLLTRGLKREDRVTLVMPNHPMVIAAMLALAKIGCIAVPLPGYYRKSEVKQIIERTASQALVICANYADFSYLEMAREIRNELNGNPETILVAEANTSEPGFYSLDEMVASHIERQYPEDYLVRFRPQPNDVCAIHFTSGTEGAPKGAMWTHNGTNTTALFNQHMRKTEADNILVLAPICHAYGYGHVISATLAACGSTVTILERFEPLEVLETIEREGISIILGVPAHYFSLINSPHLREFDLATLRCIVSGGSALPAQIITRYREELNCGSCNIWGMSETHSAMNTRIDDPLEVATNTVGRPADPSFEMAIFDEDGSKLPAGRVGELGIRGPNLFAGYFNDLQLTYSCMNQEGFFMTGDLAFIRDDGNLAFAGRKKEVINRGGEKISPRELEELLYKHPKIRDVAIVGIPDERLGERACAFVIPKHDETLSLEEVQSFLSEQQVAAFKLPERLRIVREFPRSAIGKIKKDVLAAMYDRAPSSGA